MLNEPALFSMGTRKTRWYIKLQRDKLLFIFYSITLATVGRMNWKSTRLEPPGIYKVRQPFT